MISIVRRLFALAPATLPALLGCRTGPPHAHHPPQVMAPDEGETLWLSPDGKDELGKGGELQIYVDSHTHPHARASFAKFTLGLGGALPVHRHDKTEEFAYFVSGEGVAVFVDEAGVESEVGVAPGYVWYNPPGRWHAVRNTGSTPLALVFATVPNEEKGLLSFFRRIGVTPGKEGEPITLDELRRVGAEHDMILWDPEAD